MNQELTGELFSPHGEDAKQRCYGFHEQDAKRAAQKERTDDVVCVRK